MNNQDDISRALAGIRSRLDTLASIAESQLEQAEATKRMAARLDGWNASGMPVEHVP